MDKATRKKNPAAFDFERFVDVIDWKTDKVITRLDPVVAAVIIGESLRFDPHHTTANVRVIPDRRPSESARLAFGVGLPFDHPITFEVV